MKKIFEYINFREYLHDYYQEKKAGRSGYSYRKFSEQMGFSASNHLHLVLQGKRKLSAEAIAKLAENLDFNKKEKNYFSTLVYYNQTAENDPNHQRYWTTLEQLNGKHRTLLAAEQFSYFSNWYLPILREVITLKNFKPELAWIFHVLRGKVDKAKIKEGLQLLVKLNMIQKANGKWLQSEPHLSTQHITTSEMILQYHKEMLRLSADSLNLMHEERDLTAVTMSLDQENFEWVRQRIMDFREELQAELNARNIKGDRVAQLNFQLFQVTRVR